MGTDGCWGTRCLQAALTLPSVVTLWLEPRCHIPPAVTTSPCRPDSSAMLLIKRRSRWRLGFILGNGSRRAAWPPVPFVGLPAVFSGCPPSRELVRGHVPPMLCGGAAGRDGSARKGLAGTWGKHTWVLPSHIIPGCHISRASSDTHPGTGKEDPGPLGYNQGAKGLGISPSVLREGGWGARFPAIPLVLATGTPGTPLCRWGRC